MSKIRQASSAAEIAAIARENGAVLSDDLAGEIFARLHLSGELADDEPEAVAGGGCNDYTPPSGLAEGDRVIVAYPHEVRRKKCPATREGVIDYVKRYHGESACVVYCPGCGVKHIVVEKYVRRI